MRLPEDLARLPYLQEGYGKVEGTVSGIFRHYTGWYDLNPTNLKPAPRAAVHRAVLEACGGPGPILCRARRALAEVGNQLVLELTDLILGARPKNGAARQMRRAALERLAARATNGVEQNIYRRAATALRDGAPTSMPADGGKTDDGAASIFNDTRTEQ